MRLTVTAIAVVLVLAVTTLVVNATTIMGTVGAGSGGDGFEQELAQQWNSGDFACTNSSPFTVTASNGPCLGQSAMIIFDVNSDGVSNASHDFTYQVECLNGTIGQFLGFDGAEVASLNEGNYFLFPLSGGDVVTAQTGSASFVMPTLGEWGTIALVLILLTSGIFVILRRYGPDAQAS